MYLPAKALRLSIFFVGIGLLFVAKPVYAQNLSQCNQACSKNADCDANLLCHQGVCRSVWNVESTTCSGSAPSPSASTPTTATPTPTTQPTTIPSTDSAAIVQPIQPSSLPSVAPTVTPPAFSNDQTAQPSTQMSPLEETISSFQDMLPNVPAVIFIVPAISLLLLLIVLIRRDRRATARVPHPTAPQPAPVIASRPPTAVTPPTPAATPVIPVAPPIQQQPQPAPTPQIVVPVQRPAPLTQPITSEQLLKLLPIEPVPVVAPMTNQSPSIPKSATNPMVHRLKVKGVMDGLRGNQNTQNTSST